MTDEELAQLGSYEQFRLTQDERGIDVTQIDRILRMTPAERLRSLEEFLRFDDILKKARKEFDGSISRTPEPAASKQG